uniref:CCHC-type domain-containing protein n=1 Tax=Oryza glaberrima TaxID=4538 RepID=I1Q393_ORYGL
MVNKIFKPSTLTSTTRNYYPRPTYADLQFEEMPQIQNMTYYNGKEIVEWNLDGFTEYQIFTLCHQMIMYANACIANGNKEREAANMIVIGFSGQLKGWWNNYLNETQRQEILCAVKRDDQGRPLPDRDGNGNPTGNISDALATLIYNIIYHFAGNYHDIYEKNREQLINLKCKTMSDFRWYKDTFLSKLYTLPEPNQDFWKEKYISGLPPLFAEKVRNSLRKEGGGSINYHYLDIGKITQKIQLVGAELCNDLKIKDQLKKQRILGKREMGDFCYQFGFQDPYVYRKRKTHSKPMTKPNDKSKMSFQATKRKPKRIYNKNIRTQDTESKETICYKCGLKGHIANRCFKSKVKKEIQALLDSESEDVKEKLEAILNNIDNDSSSDEEKNAEINCCQDSGCSCYEPDNSEEESDENILVLTSLEEFVLDTFETIQDPEEKRRVLEKFLSRVKTDKDKLKKDIQTSCGRQKNKKEKAHALNGLAYYFKNFVPSDQKITEKRAKLQDIPHHEERLLDYREEKSRDGQDKLPMEVEQSMATDKNTKVFSDKILISTDPASSMVVFHININNLLQSFPHNKPSLSTKKHDTTPQTPYILHNHPNSFLPQYILRTQPKAPCRSCAYKDSCQKKLKSQNPMSTTYENLQPRLSFRTEQTLSCFGQDILDLVWRKFKERQMKIFLGLQDYFFDLLEGRERNPAIRVIIYMLPLLRLDDQAISDPSYRFLVLKAEINLQRFRNLPTYNHEEISLQTIIDHGLVNSIYATLDQILQSDLGSAVKDVCRRLGHGRYRIIFSSIPPKFTPPVRPAIHYIYIMNGQFNFQEDGPSKLSDEEEEIYTTNANHENWRLFSEAAEIEEAITTDYEYQLVFQNKITRIFISKYYNQSYEYFKGAGRIIKPDFGNECSKKSYYRSLAQWFQKSEPSEIDTVQSAPMIINEDNE